MMVSFSNIILIFSCFSIHALVQVASDKVERNLLFTVNPGEGFNLQKDVILRITHAMVLLNKKNEELKRPKDVLVLPPFRYFAHWRDSPHICKKNKKTRVDNYVHCQHMETEECQFRYVNWKDFIDVPLLNKVSPAMDFTDFPLAESEVDVGIHVVYRTNIDFSKPLLAEFVPCDTWNAENPDKKTLDYTFPGSIWRDTKVQFSKDGNKVKCLSTPASTKEFVRIMEENFLEDKYLLATRLESFHWAISWQTPEYWDIRKHYSFNPELFDVAKQFLINKRINTKSYLSVHLRRTDFTTARAKDIPALDGAIAQINDLIEKNNFKKVFLASDTNAREFEILKSKIKVPLVRFNGNKYLIDGKYLSDGQVAIVDQIICSYADTFYGTFGSTFTNTIFEERVLLNFDHEKTYNTLCVKKPHDYQPPTPEDHDYRTKKISSIAGVDYVCQAPTRYLPREFRMPNDGQSSGYVFEHLGKGIEDLSEHIAAAKKKKKEKDEL